MSKNVLAQILSPILALALWGCGTGGGDDFQAGNRLSVTSIVSDAGDNVIVSKAVHETADLGPDGVVGGDTTGEGNNFPDATEPTTVFLAPDAATITVFNEPRLGTKDENGNPAGVSLFVEDVYVTYRDANGHARDFAPQQHIRVTQEVLSGEAAEIALPTFVPVGMKSDPDGLEHIFLTDPAEIPDVRDWTAIVDILAKDTLNGDTVNAQGRISIHFYNPMVESAGNGTGAGAAP